METIDWKSLEFGYSKADYNIRCWYRNGKWGELEVSDSENITLHIAATTFHYGQEAFEGLKGFPWQRWKDPGFPYGRKRQKDAAICSGCDDG